MENTGKLYIVATPIGNLGDITLRAIETLKAVNFVLCEDTRVTKKLLNHYEIDTKTISYHQHSSDKKVKEILELLEQGSDLALVTDAGTPGISDPGNKLVSVILSETKRNEVECSEVEGSPRPTKKGDLSTSTSTPSGRSVSAQDDVIIPIPGASAVVTALSISGFPTDKFIFLGFPPHKKGRNKFFTEVAEAKYTVAFYESCHRILKCLDQLAEVLKPDQEICICRELTKKFETVYRGTVGGIGNMQVKDKGEFVVIIKH